MVTYGVCSLFVALASYSSSYTDAPINYHMYTSSKDSPIEFDLSTPTTFDTNKKHVILLHGWLDHFGSHLYTNVTAEFRNHSEIVTVQVGYEEAMSCISYIGSVKLLNYLGESVGEMIIKMNKAGVPLKNIELVGHSLGAHVAGIAGATVRQKTGGEKVNRIFGLDPALPLIDQDKRLKKDDADRVIIFHTSPLGIQDAIGHADFYPNGGLGQGSCGKLHVSDHVAANYYFYCSINGSCQFKGKHCKNWLQFVFNSCDKNKDLAEMGYYVDDNASGSYYMRTNC